MAADIEVSFDRLRIDFTAAAALLVQVYRAQGRSEGQQIEAFTNSLCAAAFIEGEQVGFGRAVTDRTVIAFLCDVVVWPRFRRRGIGTRLVRAFLDHPDLERVTTWTLYTTSAHELYGRLGFERLADGNFMRLAR